MSEIATVKLEMQFAGTAGAWTDVTADWCNSARYSEGIQGKSPTDRVASTGQMTFDFDNSAGNSAGLMGYYSPGHTNCRTGFGIGLTVCLSYVYDGNTVPKFYGRIPSNGIEVDDQKYGERKTHVTVVDTMDQFANTELRLMSRVTNQRIDQIVPLIVAKLKYPPLATDYETGTFTFATGLDAISSGARAMSELQKLCMSEQSYAYITHDGTNREVFRTEAYDTRNNTTVTASIIVPTDLAGTVLTEGGDYWITENEEDFVVLDESMDMSLSDLQITSASDLESYNIIQFVSYPKSVGTAAETLFELGKELTIAPGTTNLYRVSYKDPSGGAVRVAGLGVSTPAATTGWTAFSETGGAGDNVSGSLTWTGTAGIEAAEYYWVNNYAATVFMNMYKLSGTAIKYFDPINAVIEDADRTENRPIKLEMPYQDNPEIVSSFATFILNNYKNPTLKGRSFTFTANNSVELMGAFLQTDIGSKVNLTSTGPSGVSGDFFIQAMDVEISDGGRVIDFTWTVKPANLDVYNQLIWDSGTWDSTTAYWGF